MMTHSRVTMRGWRWAGRRAQVVVCAITIAVSGCLVVGATAGAAVGPCTDVQIIGLRGSSEDFTANDFGMGKLLGPLATRILASAPDGQTLSTYGVPYPASDAIKGVISGAYWSSKAQGMTLLHSYLAEEIAACPTTRLVVTGYSQGAHSAGDQLAKEPASVTNHIAALVMFGDPRFNPATSYDHGTFDARDHGLAGARDKNDFSSWSSRVGSWCNNGDLVCQGLGWGHSTGPHGQYLAKSGDSATSWVARRLGWASTPGFRGKLDLAFAIDTTGSMASAIYGASTAAQSIVGQLAGAGADFRVGLVDYKDTNQGDPYASRLDLPFTTSASNFGTAVAALVPQATGGGDTPEAVYSGVMQAINGLSWRDGAKKAVVIMGDAAAKNPEPVTGFTATSVLNAARALDPATIYAVAIGSDPHASFQELTSGSGGELFDVTDPSEVAGSLEAAVSTVVNSPNAELTVGLPARPGDSVTFSAAGSWYADGDLSTYGWDFDGDGSIDATTTTPITSHVYPTEFHGIAAVTVTATDGKDATTTVEVNVTSDAPRPPTAPRSLTAAAGADGKSLKLDWQPPADLGGVPLGGYLVTVTLSGATEPAFVASVDALTAGLVVRDLAPGGYSVTVAAYSDAGVSPDASTGVVHVGNDVLTLQFRSRGGRVIWEASGAATTSTITLTPHSANPIRSIIGSATLLDARGRSVRARFDVRRLSLAPRLYFGTISIRGSSSITALIVGRDVRRTGESSAEGASGALMTQEHRISSGVLSWTISDTT